MKADALYYNGNFFISPLYRKKVNWLAVKDGEVMTFGQGQPDKQLLYHKSYDLENKRVVPGWNDSHVHLLNLGLRRYQIDVSNCRTEAELVAILKKRCPYNRRDRGEASWLEAYGLDTENFQTENPIFVKILDRVSRNVPIIVRRRDEHAMYINSAVIRLARLQNTEIEIQGGQIVRDESGYPTGLLVDRAMDYVLRMKPKPEVQRITQALTEAGRVFAKAGITSVHDMSTQRIPLEVLADMMRAKQYGLRVSCALYGMDAFETFPEPEANLFNNYLNIRAKKIFIDGALGSRGAWLSKPYSDEPDWSGSQLYDEKSILKILHFGIQKRFQLIFHTLGDQASRWLLKTIESKYSAEQIRERRFRFEHLEVFDPELTPLMRKYGIIASMQPWHALSDSEWIEKRLGKDRFHQVSRIKGMLSNGIHVCAGSDAPVDPHDPIQGIYAAVTRKPLSGKKSWLLDQKVKLVEAVKMYTQAGAYAEFSEHIKGTLEKGMLADFTVLSDDIFNVHVSKFPDIHTMMTVVGGNVVYAK